jgi:hypothetical protein
MTMTANRPTHVLAPGVARETIHEMAAVVRTLFGVGLQASRQAAPELATPEAAAAPAPATPAANVAGGPVPTGAIPVPGIPVPEAPAVGLPLPSIALPDMAAFEAEETVSSIEVPVLDDSPVEVPLARIPVIDVTDEPDEVVAPIALAPIPLALVPDLAPADDIGNERRAVLLSELAFLDD